MIVVEDYEKKLKRTYSNEGFYIQKKGTTEIYVDAIDLKESTFEYIETDEKIETDEPEVEYL